MYMCIGMELKVEDFFMPDFKVMKLKVEGIEDGKAA